MTESSNNVSKMQDNNASLLVPKKYKGSALDRGFPTGAVLILLVALIIILQGISAWKIMNLEKEKAEVTRDRTLLEKDIKEYEYLKTELPRLQQLKKEKEELETKVLPILKSEVDALEKQRESLNDELRETQEFIKTRGYLEKKVEALRTEIQSDTDKANQLRREINSLLAQQQEGKKQVGELDKRIKELTPMVAGLQAKHDELKRLTGPNSELAKSTEVLKAILNKLNESSSRAEETVAQAVQGLKSSADTVSRSADDLVSKATRLAESTSSNTDRLQKVSEEATNAINKVKEAGDSLNKATAGLSQRSGGLKTVTDNLRAGADRNISYLETSTKEISTMTAKIKTTASDLGTTTQTLQKVSKDTEVAGEKVKEVGDSLVQASKDLSPLINEFKRETGELETEVNRNINALGHSIDKISESIQKVSADASDFNVKLKEYDPSKIQFNLEQYKGEITKITSFSKKFESDLVALSEAFIKLKNDAEIRFKELFSEIDSTQKLLQLYENQLEPKFDKYGSFFST